MQRWFPQCWRPSHDGYALACTAVHSHFCIWILGEVVRQCTPSLLRDAQEGSTDAAHSALPSFQSMVSNQLAKMEKDFKSGSPFPGLPMIMDHKAFHVKPSQTLSILSSAYLPVLEIAH